MRECHVLTLSLCSCPGEPARAFGAVSHVIRLRWVGFSQGKCVRQGVAVSQKRQTSVVKLGEGFCPLGTRPSGTLCKLLSQGLTGQIKAYFN